VRRSTLFFPLRVLTQQFSNPPLSSRPEVYPIPVTASPSLLSSPSSSSSPSPSPPSPSSSPCASLFARRERIRPRHGRLRNTHVHLTTMSLSHLSGDRILLPYPRDLNRPHQTRVVDPPSESSNSTLPDPLSCHLSGLSRGSPLPALAQAMLLRYRSREGYNHLLAPSKVDAGHCKNYTFAHTAPRRVVTLLRLTPAQKTLHRPGKAFR
jgi:hypothetical protein